MIQQQFPPKPKPPEAAAATTAAAAAVVITSTAISTFQCHSFSLGCYILCVLESVVDSHGPLKLPNRPFFTRAGIAAGMAVKPKIKLKQFLEDHSIWIAVKTPGAPPHSAA